jgi:hypothetical protein
MDDAEDLCISGETAIRAIYFGLLEAVENDVEAYPKLRVSFHRIDLQGVGSPHLIFFRPWICTSKSPLKDHPVAYSRTLQQFCIA